VLHTSKLGRLTPHMFASVQAAAGTSLLLSVNLNLARCATHPCEPQAVQERHLAAPGAARMIDRQLWLVHLCGEVPTPCQEH